MKPNLAKLGDGLDERPAVMVGDRKQTENRGILKPSWAFIETKIGSLHLSSSFTSMAPPSRLSVEILLHPTNPFEDLCWDHGFPKGHYHVMNLLTQFI